MTADGRSEQKPDAKNPRLGGLGVAAALASWGIVFLVAPTYLDIGGRWQTAFYWIAVILAVIGGAGALMEIGKITNQEGWTYIGVALVFLMPALILFVVDRYREIGSPWKGLARVSVLGLCIVGAGMLFYGLAYFAEPVPSVEAKQRPPATRRADVFRSIGAAFIGLLNFATAIIGPIAAIKG
jgi:hypothetical protein